MKSKILFRNTFYRIINIIIIFVLFLEIGLSNAHCMTINKECELSKKIMQIIKEKFTLIEDITSLNYLDKIGKKIVDSIVNNPYNYKFHIINNHDLNAFAIPGGHVFIYTGLIGVLESEEELAGILAHEIAHISCRHIPHNIEESSKINLLALATTLASILISPNITDTLIFTSIATQEIIIKALSRENERQADKVGIKYAQKAGYTGKGLIDALKTINKYKFSSMNHKSSTYLSSHPPIEERLEYIENFIYQHEIPIDQTERDSKLFKLFQTKITALHEPEKNVLNKFKSILESYPENDSANYGYSLLLTRSKNWVNTIKYMKKAIEKNASNQNMFFELGKMYFEYGKYNKAIFLLKNCSPDIDFKGTLYLARAQMEISNLNNAKKIFNYLIQFKNDYANTYYFLSKINVLEGNLMEAYYNLGMYYSKEQVHDKSVAAFKKSLDYTNNEDHVKKIKNMIKDEKIYMNETLTKSNL